MANAVVSEHDVPAILNVLTSSSAFVMSISIPQN